MTLRRLTTAVMLGAAILAAAAAGVDERPADIPDEAPVLGGYALRDSLRARLDSSELSPVEGIWEFGNPGCEVIIVAGTLGGTGTTAYLMVCTRGGRFAIEPGTVVGYILPTPHPDAYDAWIYSRGDSGRLTSVRRYALSTDGDGLLSFTEARSGYRYSPGRLFSNIFIIGLRYHNSIPDDHRGCRRTYPPAGSPEHPVYL